MLNDQAPVDELLDDVGRDGRVALVIDVPTSAAQLLLTISHNRQMPVASVTGLQMRRAADFYAGSAQTDSPPTPARPGRQTLRQVDQTTPARHAAGTVG